jgi:hypothetical protein
LQSWQFTFERLTAQGDFAVTTQEHLLIIMALAKQAQFVKLFSELLKSKGIVSQDDLSAFDFAVTQDFASNASLLEQVKTAYLHLAKGAGVTTGLETP